MEALIMLMLTLSFSHYGDHFRLANDVYADSGFQQYLLKVVDRLTTRLVIDLLHSAVVTPRASGV